MREAPGSLPCVTRWDYQTLINDALLEHVHRRSTLDVVRRVVREELAPYGARRRSNSRLQRARTTRR